MGTHLDDFLEKIRGLPQQVMRNFDLIRQLDEVGCHLLSASAIADAVFCFGVYMCVCVCVCLRVFGSPSQPYVR
jgi:hypothetical protein